MGDADARGLLGLTVVALQLSSTQFSPRLLRTFLRDRLNQVVLSVFVATFTYATAGLYTVGVESGQRADEYPRGGGADPHAFDEVLRYAARIGFERTAEQDVAFGVRQLDDIAVKALSAAINDPYTAIQALEHLGVVLASLAGRPLGGQLLTDDDGAPRVWMPGRDLHYYLDLAFGQVRRYGRAEPRVVLGLIRVLRTTARFCRDDAGRKLVADQLRLVLEDATEAIRQPADLEPVRLSAAKALREIS